MSLTYGFYNSLNHDRRYNSLQMSSIFDGIIRDGIFASIGDCFNVLAGDGMTVNVGTGKAWFNHTWTENDSKLPITAFESEVVLNRIDSLILEVDATDSVRANSIKFIKGTPSSNPVAPTLINEGTLHQYLLCNVKINAGCVAITQSMITSYIGESGAPFVTGILSVVDLTTLLGQWRTELDEFVASEKTDFDTDYQQMKKDLHAAQAELNLWTTNEKTSFTEWFDSIKGQLSTDQAGNLQNEIDKEEIKRIFLAGISDGTKTFSEDGSTITTIGSDKKKLVKTFSEDGLTITSILTDKNSSELAKMVKTFSEDGSEISTVITYK